MTPSDDDIRMLLETYRFCRKFAHSGEVGTNAVTLIAALEELLEHRSIKNAEKQQNATNHSANA